VKEKAIVNTEALLNAAKNVDTKEACFILSKSKNIGSERAPGLKAQRRHPFLLK